MARLKAKWQTCLNIPPQINIPQLVGVSLYTLNQKVKDNQGIEYIKMHIIQ